MNPFCELAVEQSLRLREGKVKSLPVESIVAVSIGPAKTVDTLRTALAMGADKAIHVEVNDDPEPLGVAKVLKAIAEKEKSNLILLGKQSIDRDFGQTGQMLGGLLGWPQATCAAKMEITEDEKCIVTEEVDGGVQTVSAKLPMIVTTDLRYLCMS
jgi:electron transfer flavoprotein beta subunit